MKDIAFTGFYGMKNFGDDLFAHVSIWGQRKYWPEMSSTVISPPIKGLEGYCWISGAALSRIYPGRGPAARLVRLGCSLSARLTSRRLIYAGGSLYSDVRRLSVRGVVDKIKSKDVAAIGVSIGPFVSAEAERRVAKWLQQFEYVSVRDAESYNRLSAFNLASPVVESRDLAGLAPEFVRGVGRGVENRRAVRIGFSPCNWTSRSEKPLELCAGFVKSLATYEGEKENLSVTILCLNEHQAQGDRYLCEYTHKLLCDAGIRAEVLGYSTLGVKRTIETISSFDAYVSGRLHGAVTAYLYDIPFVLFEYHGKCAAFAEDIGQDSALRAKGIGDLSGCLQVLLMQPPTPHFPVAEYRNLAARNFTNAPWVERK